MVTAKPTKSPIPRPGENVDPEPLADDLRTAWLRNKECTLEEASAEAGADSISMEHAAALEVLYQSEAWVAEWLKIKPVKPNAAGRMYEPNSRNRFNQWMAWRASKEGWKPPRAAHTYRLLNARKVQHCLSRGVSSKMTERAIRPIAWMLTREYDERIKEVEQIAIELANGGPITDTITRKAMSEWKKANLGDRGVTKANREAKARNYRPTADRAFDQLMLDDVKQAEAFLEACLDKLERAKGIA